jgi:hypothetical protein
VSDHGEWNPTTVARDSAAAGALSSSDNSRPGNDFSPGNGRRILVAGAGLHQISLQRYQSAEFV